MSTDLLIGLALALVFGGLLPAISPATYKRVVNEIASLPHGSVRAVGLVFMLLGAVLLYIVH